MIIKKLLLLINLLKEKIFEEKLNVEKISFTNNTKIDSDNKSDVTLDNVQNINLDKNINASENIEIQNNKR